MTSICLAHGGDIGAPSGGTDRVTALAAALDEAGHDLRLVVPEPTGPVPDRVAHLARETVAVPTTGVRTQPKRAWRVARRAQSVAAAHDASIQFAHSTLAGVGTIAGDRPFVLDMHDLAFRSPLYGDLPLGGLVQRVIRAIETRGVERAEAIVVVSETMGDLVSEEWDVPSDRIAVVPNGYVPDRVAPYRGLDPEPGRVVFLGTLHPKLDVETFVEIAARPAVEELVIIGDANRREALEAASRDEATLRVTGRLPDDEAFELVGSAAVAINPQQSSPLQRASCPVKLAYYAALGVPAVVSAGPDLADWLAERDCAVTVPPDGDMASAVADLLADDDRRAAMRANALAAAPDLAWSARADRLIEVYDDLGGIA